MKEGRNLSAIEVVLVVVLVLQRRFVSRVHLGLYIEGGLYFHRLLEDVVYVVEDTLNLFGRLWL